MMEIVYSNHVIEASPHNHSKREQWFGPTISAAISSGSATHFGQLGFQHRGVCPRTSYHLVMCHSSLFGELVIFGKGLTCVLRRCRWRCCSYIRSTSRMKPREKLVQLCSVVCNSNWMGTKGSTFETFTLTNAGPITFLGDKIRSI